MQTLYPISCFKTLIVDISAYMFQRGKYVSPKFVLTSKSIARHPQVFLTINSPLILGWREKCPPRIHTHHSTREHSNSKT